MLKILLGACALVAATAANASTTISLGGSNVDWGNTHTFTSGPYSIVASGFTAANAATHLFGKNGGSDEIGLGLVNDPSHDNEIYFGMGYVQLDVSQLFGLVSSVSFTTNSTTQGEQWSIYGSNTAGSYSVANLLLQGTNESGGTLPGIGSQSYKYYDFVSTSQSGGKNFLIGTLSITPVPEPSTWAMMLLGFGVIGIATRRRRRAAVALVA